MKLHEVTVTAEIAPPLEIAYHASYHPSHLENDPLSYLFTHLAQKEGRYCLINFSLASAWEGYHSVNVHVQNSKHWKAQVTCVSRIQGFKVQHYVSD